MARRGSSAWKGGEPRKVTCDKVAPVVLGTGLRALGIREDEGKVLVVAIWAMWVGRGLSTARSSPARMATAERRKRCTRASVGAGVLFIGRYA